jgi:hypothetical protein
VEKYLRDATKVPFSSLYLDPNNPRLALEESPGYEDPDRLFDGDLQDHVADLIGKVYDVDSLQKAIVAQGWMPIDNILVWTYPTMPDRHVVLEGNTRTTALRKIRFLLNKAQEKLEDMRNGRRPYPQSEIKDQEQLVAKMARIVEDTNEISVVPLDADTVEELERKLPRVLAVRHITGAKSWGNYAEDLWLLARYVQLFEDNYGEQTALRWEQSLIKQLAGEASLDETSTKRKLRASSVFSRFRREFEDALPDGEQFKDTDYYLFENIIKKPWIRQKFELSDDALYMPTEKSQVLFDWVFKLPRGRDADENPNVFYRHENVLVWDQIKRYDDQNGTTFAARLDVENHETVPSFNTIEVDYLAHKARRQPTDVIDQLIRQFGELKVETLIREGEFFRAQLAHLAAMSKKYLEMIEATS